eukprot:3675208-Rhodomonas_salina.1
MLDYGFTPIGPDGVMFRLNRGNEKLIVSLYVDDGVCTSNSDDLYSTFPGDISKKYTLSNSGRLSFYLGVAIDHDKEKGVSTLSQESYINTLLERFSMTDAHPVPTPSEQGTCLLKLMCLAVPNAEDKHKYQQLIGGLMYAAVLTCPDISFTVNQCESFMSNPGPEHIAAAKQILCYLKGSK